MEPGSDFGRYRIVREVAQGGMGVVFEAEDRDLRRRVALKVLRGEVGPRLVERLHREASIAARLRHPNIVAVHDVGVHEGVHYIAMDFVDGETLEAIVRRGMRGRDAAALLRTVAQAVAHAHREGVVHRDLKPANVIIDKDGRPMITDFGLARMGHEFTTLTATGQVMGTPAFMAPEQVAANARGIGPRTDVWALGVILYEMLTGRAPFDADAPLAIYQAVMTRDPEPPSRLRPDVSRELEAVCLKALEKDPDRRYADAAEMAEDLSRWLDGDAVRARTVGLGTRVVRRLRRKPWMAGAAALAALAVALVVILAAERRSRASARLHLDAGGRLVEQMRARRADPAYTLDELKRLAEVACAEFAKAADHPEAHVGIGRARALVGQDVEALTAFARANSMSPGFAPAYFERVRVQVARYEEMRRREGEAEDARMMREQIERDLQRCGEARERLFGRGVLAVVDERFAEAEKLLAEYLELAPADSSALYWRGHALWMLRRHAEAERSCEGALKLDARLAAAYNLRGLARRLRGELAGAIRDYDNAIVLKPKADGAWSNRGRARFEKGDAAGGIADCEKALELNPAAPHAHYALGYIRWKQGRLDEALVRYSDAIRRAPRDAAAYDDRGRIRSERREWDAAIADYDRSIELEPGAAAYVDRGAARQGKRDWDGAIADCDSALALRPDCAAAYNNRGRCRLEKGDESGALADLERSIGLDPSSPLPWYNRGALYLRRNDVEAALAQFREAVKVDPRCAIAWYDLGRIHNRRRDWEAAVAAFTRAIELDGKNADAYTDRGLSRHGREEWAKAIEDHSEAIQLRPDFASAWNNRGVAKRFAGDLRGAVEDYTRALELDGRRAEWWTNRGYARMRLEEWRGALDDFERALEVAPPEWPKRAEAQDFIAGLRKRLGT